MANYAKTWCGIENIGRIVVDDEGIVKSEWKTISCLAYRDGYSCKKLFEVNNVSYYITIRIFNSQLRHPIFEYNFSKDGESVRILSSNPTTVYRKVLEKLEMQLEGKLNGQRFLGLLSKDYEIASKTCNEQEEM